ncbi:MAG: hypothetical protein WD295_06610, partial [Bacteroidota bacterium]
QYTDFQWQVLKTDHFDIYFYPEMRELAERGAFFAEEAYKQLERKFNHNIAGRIPLIFYSSHLHFQQTNVTPGFIPEGVGGFFEFLKGRVVIPSNGSTEQFAHVIRHELVHVFTHSKINRVLLDHRLAQDRFPPLWFVEGIAEFWSTRWDTQAEMVMRDAVINNYVVPLRQIDRIYGSFLMYKQGQQILEFIAERYGEETILLLMENFWRANTFSEVMKATIGKDYREFDEEWLYYLKKRYYPVLADQDLPSGVTKNVVDVGFNSKPLAFSHGGKRWVYFIGNHTGYTGVYRADLDAEKPEPEVVIAGERTDEFEAFHLFQSKLDISRDGLLAFVTKSGENDALHLYDIHEDRLRETIRFKSLVVLGSPTWSPDGRRIAFSSIDKSGNNDLYVLDLASRELLRLTNDFYDDRDPSWSPDGNFLAFSSDRTPHGEKGRYNIFAYDFRSSDIFYMTYGDHNDFSPSWSPDGSKLIFTSDLDGAQNIWIMEVGDLQAAPHDGLSRTIRKVTNFSTASFDPSWGDNDELLFTAFEKFSFQIKLLPRITDLHDRSAIVKTIDYSDIGDRWVPKRLEGPAVIGQYRYDGEYNLDIAQSQIST